MNVEHAIEASPGRECSNLISRCFRALVPDHTHLIEHRTLMLRIAAHFQPTGSGSAGYSRVNRVGRNRAVGAEQLAATCHLL
jgi:hypothetical protein